MLHRTALCTSLLALALTAGAAGAAAEAATLELVSRVDPGRISDTGTGAGPTNPGFVETLHPPSISADGRYAVFLSNSSNLIPGQIDRNRAADVFLTDLTTGVTTLVSHALGSAVTAGNAGSTEAVISADGRYVAFISSAQDLVPGQLPPHSSFALYAFLYDRITGTTLPVACNCRDDGFDLEDLSLSADGRYLVFVNDSNRAIPGLQGSSSKNVFLYDRVEKTTRLVSHASGSATVPLGEECENPSLSGDGRYAVFRCSHFEFLGPYQTFLFDRDSGHLAMIGQAAVALISNDGRYIALQGGSRVSLYERETGQITLLTDSSILEPEYARAPLAISADGRFVALVHDERQQDSQGQTVNDRIVLLYDRASRALTPASRPHQPAANTNGVDAFSISADGRYLAFASSNTDLVPGQTDTNNHWDLFLFDRNSGRTTLVSSVGATTTTGDSFSFLSRISENGARIIFDSTAGNLLPELKDLNDGHDVFVHEVATRSNSLISRHAPSLPSLSSSFESQIPALSADGRFVAFESHSPELVAGQIDANRTTDVFLYDRATRSTVLVSRTRASAAIAPMAANGQSLRPVLSADGRFVAFASNAPDLAPGAEDPARNYDVFLFDRVLGTVTLVGRTGVSVSPDASGIPPFHRPQISQDGRWVAFLSMERDLVPGQQDQSTQTADLFLWDRISGTTVLVSRSSAGPLVTGSGSSSYALLSEDGRYVTFRSEATDLVPGQIDVEQTQDVFQFDRVTGGMTLVTHARGSTVTAATGLGFSMSADGRFVVFSTDLGRLYSGTPGTQSSIYLYDRVLGTHEWIADFSFDAVPRISADGRFVSYMSSSFELPTSGDQVFLFDRITKSRTLVTRSATQPGQASLNGAFNAGISADGRYVALLSTADDLIAGLTEVPGRQESDVYLFDRVAGTVTLASGWRASASTRAGDSWASVLSASGRQVAFNSYADLTENDFNNRLDVFVFSLDPPPPVTLPTCKLLDTRRRADRPVLTSNVQRAVTLRGACGVPATAKQVVVKVTVFNPSGKGNLRFYPGAVTADPSGILRFEPGATRTETFTLPLSANGTLTILPFVAGKGTVHVAVEVTGYAN